MKPIKKEQISQEVFDLYDDYAYNRIDRRKFLEKLSIYAVGGITLGSLLSFVTPNYIGTSGRPANYFRLSHIQLY